MTEKISVIIPVHNGERYLPEAIRSVLNQTYPVAQLIVVDNGSTDRSAGAARSFGSSVTVLHEPRIGPAQARNAGLRAASGDFIAFLDADDVWETGKLARQIDVFNARPNTALVFTNIREFVSPDLAQHMNLPATARPDDYPGLSASTMLARASCFRCVGFLPEVPIGEFIAWYGIAQTAGLRSDTVPEVLVRRRVHLSNMTFLKRHDKSGYLKAAKLVLDARRARAV